MELAYLIASGYDWTCNECGADNHEVAINVVGTAIGDVKCETCGETFEVGGYDHCYSR